MSERILHSLEGVSETLLIPLYIRARESQRPDAMIRDDLAVAIIDQIEHDYSRIQLQGHDEVAIIMRQNKFDSHVRAFLARNSQAVVVHIGCGPTQGKHFSIAEFNFFPQQAVGKNLYLYRLALKDVFLCVYRQITD